jgi:hypothetical protein
MIPALGIDIGRVIISAGSGRGDTSFLDGDLAAALRTPPARDALPIIRDLVVTFGGRVWLVSKAGPRVQDRTRRWLDHHRFWEVTGMNRAKLRFCRRRDEKAEIARELGLTHFIDDRPDVLAAMLGVVRFRFLFGPQRAAPPQHTHVLDWQSAAAAIRASLTGAETSGSAAAPTR